MSDKKRGRAQAAAVLTQEDREAQECGREAGLAVGITFAEWLDDSGQLAGPVSVIAHDGADAGYLLRVNVQHVLEHRRPRRAERFARRYAVNFCRYFDLAVRQLTGDNPTGAWWQWFTPAQERDLLDAPALSESQIQEAWAKYRAGRWAAGLPLQRVEHPDWRLPLDMDTGESEAQP